MDRAVKKVSIAIILILVLTIGGIFYSRRPKKLPSSSVPKTELAATSSPADFNLQAYAAGQANLDAILSAKLAENRGLDGSAGLAYRPAAPKVYKAANLKITYARTPTALRAYGLALTKALAPFGTDHENEIALMLAALAAKDQTKVQALLNILTADRLALAELLKVTVPQKAVVAHLALTNSIAKNIALIEDMAAILDDPYQAIQSADLYRVEKIAFLKAVDKVNALFQDSGISFRPEESGNIKVN